MDSVLTRLEAELARLSGTPREEESGVVRTAGDGIAEIEGLAGAMASEMIVFRKDAAQTLEEALKDGEALAGIVLNLEEDAVKVAILGDGASVYEGMIATRTKTLLSLPVGDSLVGRVVDPLGRLLDGKGAAAGLSRRPIEREAYGVIDRSSVSEPIHTGIKAIDAMIPIGRGQRELIIGDRGTGKTAVAVDAILAQRFEPAEKRPICIYVAIGQKESKTAKLVAELAEKGAMEYTIVVTASASAPAVLQYLAPFAGAAIGEHFMESGRDALVIYDDLSKQAVAYRQLSLLLRRPPGREAYPGDIFYLHSRLLERAAKLSKEHGGGSLTALPIIETQENDVSAYIPTNVISITDGQIYLEADLFNKGTRPAINVGLSVSRVGSSAQTKAMKKVAGNVRLELAQFRDLEAFAQFASDLDEDTKAKIDTGRRMTALLTQGRGVPVPFHLQVVSLWGAANGLLQNSDPQRIRDRERDWLEYLAREEGETLAAIATSRDLTDETKEALGAALARFLERNPGA